MAEPLPTTTFLPQGDFQQNWQQSAMNYEVQAPLPQISFPQQAMPSSMAPAPQIPTRKKGRPPGSKDSTKRLPKGTVKAMAPEQKRAHRGFQRHQRALNAIVAHDVFQASVSDPGLPGFVDETFFDGNGSFGGMS
jgi:hypothetical protein